MKDVKDNSTTDYVSEIAQSTAIVGRPKTSKLTRAEQVKEAQKRFRMKHKAVVGGVEKQNAQLKRNLNNTIKFIQGKLNENKQLAEIPSQLVNSDYEIIIKKLTLKLGANLFDEV